MMHSIMYKYLKQFILDILNFKWIIIKKVQKMNDIWDWASNILIPNLCISKLNNSQTVNQSFLINDLSSVIIGNAIIKQKRVSGGIN